MTERVFTSQENSEFRQCASDGLKLLGISASTSPLESVEAVENYVDNWQKPKNGFFAKLLNRKPSPTSVALSLGAVWGDQLVREFGWEWTCLQSDGYDLYCVASKDRSLAIFPTYFIKYCLDDSTADCTATLAFNMLKAESIPPQTAGCFINVMDGVHRIVPKT